MSELWKKLYAIAEVFKFGKKAKAGGNVVTPIARAAFVTLFTPRPPKDKPDGDKKYSVTLLFPPEADFTLLKEIVFAAAEEKWGKDREAWPHRFDEDGKKISTLRFPFRDQGEKAFEGFVRGCKYINISTSQKPGVVDPNGNYITDESKIYSGCWVWATVNAFAYDNSGNKGVSLGLTNVQLISEDDKLGGRPRAESEFEPVAMPATAAAAAKGAGTIFEM